MEIKKHTYFHFLLLTLKSIILLLGITFNENAWALSNESLREGTHSEFPLRSAGDSKTSLATSLETVVFRSGGLDGTGFNRTIKDIAVPTLTVYRPANPAQRKTALVVCPGGGYGTVVIDREGHAIARYFEQQGITVAVLKYRLPTSETFSSDLPVSQQDALEALRFMRRHADEWGFDKDHVGIMGFSAGGHLAGSTAVFGDAADGSRPDFVVLIYPVVLMDGPFMHKGSRDNLIGLAPAPERVEEFSLERRVQPDMPPFFIVHAKDDTGVPVQNSMLLADGLKKVGGTAELLLVDTGGHGFSLGRGKDSACWKDRFLAWLDDLSSISRQQHP